MRADEHGVVEIHHVPDQGLRSVAEVLLVQFIVDQEVAVVVGEPTLMGVGRTRVGGSGELDGSGLVADVHDGHGVLVGGQTDLLAQVGGVRPRVDHALDVVGIPVAAETARRNRGGGGGDVDHVQATAAGARSYRVRESRCLVDRNVVGVGESRVVGR